MSSSDEISNFINKSDKVFLLSDEDSNISLDIPFKNQHSGSISIAIEAESPIFIRNHYVEGDDSYPREKDGKIQIISQEFCHYDGKRYIPSSSIKGMIRNTLEIMSYGKLKNKTLDRYLEKKVPEENLHRSEQMDLSEAIFGTTELKGRVQFSHFKEIGHSQEMPLKKEILGTPEAKEKKFGWKNYPILEHTTAGKGGKNDKVKSEFKPLPAGTKFEGLMRFHNLRDYELGVLFSALTFHNTDNCFHNIGLGKALGYGEISITFNYDNQNSYLQAFEEKINAEIFDGKILWHTSPYLKELIKKHGKKSTTIKTYAQEANIKDIYEKVQQIKREEKARNDAIKMKEKMEREFTSALGSDSEAVLKSFIDKYPDYYNVDKIQEKYNALYEAKKSSKINDQNLKVQNAWNDVISKKSNIKQYTKLLEKFIKKWEAKKNNKGSEFILDLVEKAKAELK